VRSDVLATATEVEEIRPMKKLRIYVDTSVLGGCFEPEFV
jgi:hypothetical protein